MRPKILAIKKFNNIQPNYKEANEFLRNILFIALGILISFLFVRTTLPHVKTPNKFDELLDVINKNYVDSIDYQNIEGKAVNNLLSNLDPHSVYISKEDIQAANESLSGYFSGIGIEFYIVHDTIVIVSPLPNGPSELAGIISGDKIIKIDDTIVAGNKITNRDVFQKLRGKKGTTVKLTIQRDKKILPVFTLKRDDIVVNSVENGFLIDDKTGFIKINSFGEKTYEEFVNQLRTLKEAEIENLVIDLRQNTGGFLEIAVKILDELISGKKLLVYTNGLKYPREEFYSGNSGLFEKGKLIVLIDEGSASASEILAGAVQDLDRGLVIGRRSFGKGLVQNQIQLRDGSAVRLTVAKYYTPSGRNIQKPYKAVQDYQDEVYNRYKNGELFNANVQAQNDTATYYTSKKRKVIGGGGIYPDHFIALDTNYDYMSLSALRSAVPDYVYSNRQKFAPIVESYHGMNNFINEFSISKNLLNNFYQYAKTQGIKWNERNNQNYEARLKTSLKSYIAKQFFKDIGFQKVINQKDPMIKKSLELFYSTNSSLNQ